MPSLGESTPAEPGDHSQAFERAITGGKEASRGKVISRADPPNDSNALIPVQLDWWKNGLDAQGRPTGDNIAYDNSKTRAKVLHYPVIHCRRGSMGYKLEWMPQGASRPLTMMYSSDTKPDWNSIHHAINRDAAGVPQVWTFISTKWLWRLRLLRFDQTQHDTKKARSGKWGACTRRFISARLKIQRGADLTTGTPPTHT